MKIVVDHKHIIKALTSANRLIDKRSTVPILSNIKIQTIGDDKIEVSATDLQMELTCLLPAIVAKPGALTVPAFMALEIAKKLSADDQITLQTIEGEEKDEGSGQVEITSGASVFRLGTLPADTFPSSSQEKMGISFDIDAKEFSKSLNRCSFAITDDETRYTLNGVYIHPVKDDEGQVRLNLVATDGHRLAKIRVPHIELLQEFDGIILPKKAVMEVEKLAEHSETSKISMSLSSTKCSLKFGESTCMITRLIEGNFPNYTKVIPEGHPNSATINRNNFYKAVQRVALVSNDKFGAIKLSLTNNSMLLTANSLEYGSAKEDLPITFSGNKLEIGFNAKYLMDVLTNISGDNVTLSLRDAGTAALFTDEKDPHSAFVIMPMRA